VCHLTAQGGLTQTERDWRIAQGLCLYCGGQGHKATECSKASEKTGRAAQTMDTTLTPPISSTMPVEPKITVILEN
jgi:radical SAM superfamily enzyme